MAKEVIEYAGQQVGIAVPENGNLKFIAVKFHVMELDNKLYPSVAAVQNAIRTLEAHRPHAA